MPENPLIQPMKQFSDFGNGLSDMTIKTIKTMGENDPVFNLIKSLQVGGGLYNQKTTTSELNKANIFG